MSRGELSRRTLRRGAARAMPGGRTRSMPSSRSIRTGCSRMPAPATANGAPARSSGPCSDYPFPVKDSVNTRDYPTTGGTPALRNFRPHEDAPLVAALRSAGAIVLGKTNLHELSFGWTSNNLAFGAVHNPYDPARIPGGSSGGYRRGDRGAPGAPRGGRRYRRVHSRPRGVLRHHGIQADHGALLDARLRADFAAVRSGRTACAHGRGSGIVRRRRPQRCASARAALAAGRASRHRARLLVHRSRLGGGARLEPRSGATRERGRKAHRNANAGPRAAHRSDDRSGAKPRRPLRSATLSQGVRMPVSRSKS